MISGFLAPRPMTGINWIGLQTLITKEVQRFMSVWVQTVLTPMVTAILYFSVFAVSLGRDGLPVHGGDYYLFLAPGLIMMSMIQNAFANTSSSLTIAKVQGSIVDLLMPPLSAGELLAGFVVGGVLRGFIVGIACVVAILFFIPLPMPNFLWLFSFALLSNMMLATMGVISGLWSQKFDQMALITNFIVMPLSFLSGTFYAVSQLPPFWQTVTFFNPFHYMMDGFRAAFLGNSEFNLSVAAGLLVFWNAVLLGIAWRMLYTGYRTKN